MKNRFSLAAAFILLISVCLTASAWVILKLNPYN
jgi:hypothetical protein